AKRTKRIRVFVKTTSSKPHHMLPQKIERGRVRFGKKHMSIPMERPVPGSYQHDGDFQQLEGPYFGRYGGQWMPESLMAALQEVEETFRKAIKDPEFIAELNDLNTNYINRPSLLTER